MNSRIGQAFLKRLPVGSVQQHVFLWQIEQIPVPTFGSKLSEEISNTVRDAYRADQSSRDLLDDAERAIIAELGLANWTRPEPLTYQRTAREILEANRFDSQHFEPRFASLELRLRESGNCSVMSDLLSINKRGKQPDYAEEGVVVINSKHVLRDEVKIDNDRRAIT